MSNSKNYFNLTKLSKLILWLLKNKKSYHEIFILFTFSVYLIEYKYIQYFSTKKCICLIHSLQQSKQKISNIFYFQFPWNFFLVSLVYDFCSNIVLLSFFQFILDPPPLRFLESFKELFLKPDIIRTKVPQSVWTLVIPPNLIWKMFQ